MSSEIHRRLLERVERGKLDLPILSETASQVMQISTKEDCDAKKLAELIRSDQTLAGHLLRVVNSPLYMPKSPIVSLQQAVARLGMSTIRQIVIVIACQTRTFRVRGFGPMVKEQFLHSICAAIFAQEVARLRKTNVEEAFLCGLLHDVGKPVLLQTIVDIASELKFPIADLSIEPWLVDLHARVGADLARSWHLPERVCEAIRDHHSAQTVTMDASTALVRLADDLSHLALGSRRVREADLRDHPALAQMNMYPEEFEGVLSRRPEVVEMVRAFA